MPGSRRRPYLSAYGSKPWSKPHRFAVEELLDLYYPVVRSPNSQAPQRKEGRELEPVGGKAPRSTTARNKEETTATKPRKRPKAAGAEKGKTSFV
jgi:hypothetical protein